MVENTAIKMYRHSDRLTVAALMPGLEPEDLRVELRADGSLSMSGELRGGVRDEREVLIDEWSQGVYSRDIDLPVPVDGEMANVTYRNGVLVVSLPVAEKTRAARFSIQEVGVAQGQRVGNAGHPIRQSSTTEHRSAMTRRPV
jgi:HSP20 family protein